MGGIPCFLIPKGGGVRGGVPAAFLAPRLRARSLGLSPGGGKSFRSARLKGPPAPGRISGALIPAADDVGGIGNLGMGGPPGRPGPPIKPPLGAGAPPAPPPWVNNWLTAAAAADCGGSPGRLGSLNPGGMTGVMPAMGLLMLGMGKPFFSASSICCSKEG